MAAPMYNVFVGTETGLLKGIDVSKNTWVNVNEVESADKSREIVSLCWGDKNESTLCFGTKNHHILTYKLENGDCTFTNELSFDGGKGKLRGIAMIDNNFVTCVDSGLVKLWENETLITEFNAGENLFCFCQNEGNKNHFVTGGKENDLKLWDISRPKDPVFQAKNVRNDWLDLRVPVWVLGAQFLPSSDNNKIVTSTGHHQIRVYDPQVQRRPVMDMNFDEYPITAISICEWNDKIVVVGNAQGNMASIDLRMGKPQHVFKGFAGGIRNIVCHKSLPLAASCGLDRHLRIHDLNTKQLLHKHYLKSRLNSILMTTKWLDDSVKINDVKEDVCNTDKVEDNDVDGDEDVDEVWDQMKVVHTKTVKKCAEENSDIAPTKKRKHSSKESVKRQKQKMRR